MKVYDGYGSVKLGIMFRCSFYINIELKSIQFADVITCMYISTDALFEFPFPVKNSIESNLRLQIVLNCLMHS